MRRITEHAPLVHSVNPLSLDHSLTDVSLTHNAQPVQTGHTVLLNWNKYTPMVLQTLAKAFEGLLLTAHQLSCRETILEQRLKYAHTEATTLLSRLK